MEKQREYSLDVLKCGLTVLVLLHHYQQDCGVYFPGSVNFFGGSFYFGYMVEFFFILSGYFAYSNIRKIDRDSSFFLFYGRKFMRFFPLLLLTCVSYYFLEKQLTVVNGEIFHYSIWQLVGGIFCFGRWFSEGMMVNNPIWYVSVLLLCNMVFFAATYLARRWEIRPFPLYFGIMLFGMALHDRVSGAESYLPFLNDSVSRGLICFFEGLLLRELLERYQLHRSGLIQTGALLLTAGYVLLFSRIPSLNEVYLLDFCLFPAILILFKSRPACRLFSGRLFRNLGELSYNAYMWHVNVLIVLLLILGRDNPILHSVPFMLLTVCVIYGFAAISLFCLDRPLSCLVQKRLKSWNEKCIVWNQKDMEA